MYVSASSQQQCEHASRDAAINEPKRMRSKAGTPTPKVYADKRLTERADNHVAPVPA